MAKRLRTAQFLVAAGGGWAWNALKNSVKQLIGRERRFDERGLFAWQLVLHLTGVRPIRAITCRYSEGFEGACSQAEQIMNAICFARLNGLTYLHTPFQRISHADRPMPEWCAAWESLLSLGAREAECKVERRKVVNFYCSWRGLSLCFGWEGRGKELAEGFESLVPELRTKYRTNNPARTCRYITVAVHIRRGDVSAKEYAFYFTKDEVVLCTLTSVTAVLDRHGLERRVRVYSQGEPADFAVFSELGAELAINADPLQTFRELADADILVLAKGYFSFCAGVISRGIKVYEGPAGPLAGETLPPSSAWAYLSPPEGWIPHGPDGRFDEEELERRLLELTERKRA